MTDLDRDIVTQRPENADVPSWISQFKADDIQISSVDQLPDKLKRDLVSGIGIEQLYDLTKKVSAIGSDFHSYSYYEIAGYRNAIGKLRQLGIGLVGNGDAVDFESKLNRFHGLNVRPARRPLIICGYDGIDVNVLTEATVDELNMPTVKVMWQGGMSVGGFTTIANKQAMRVSRNNNPFGYISNNGGCLVFENIDTWDFGVTGFQEEFIIQNMVLKMVGNTKPKMGIELLEDAINNEAVTILATATNANIEQGDFSAFFGDADVVCVDEPDDAERLDIWKTLIEEHASLNSQDIYELVALSAGMSRNGIIDAVKEAISESYYSGIKNGSCESIKRENLFEKMILRQDPDSEEFKLLQEELLKSFADNLSV